MPTVLRFSGISMSLAATLTLTLFAGCGSDNKNTTDVASGGIAILNSDYAVTSVSLYDPASKKVVDACAHTDTTLTQPLSGDVTLPTQTAWDHELVAIDRKASVLTFVDPASCMTRGQLSVSTGFKAIPHDFITISQHKAYVTRYETNLAPTDDPTDLDEGDDILVVDPQAVGAGQTPILKRIALAAYASAVDGATIQARPDRGVFVNGKVYVVLGNISGDFFATGTGSVAVIDPATDTVTGTIDLSPWKGCSAVDAVEGTNRLYVSCGGSFNDKEQAPTSALVEIDLSGATPVLGRNIPASAVGNQPINFSNAAVLGETAYIATMGSQDFATMTLIAPDSFYAVDLTSQTAAKLLDAGGAFNFGRVAVDGAHKRVLLPDGNPITPLVHIFDASGASVVAAGTFDANPEGHLPPREIASY